MRHSVQLIYIVAGSRLLQLFVNVIEFGVLIHGVVATAWCHNNVEPILHSLQLIEAPLASGTSASHFQDSSLCSMSVLLLLHINRRIMSHALYDNGCLNRSEGGLYSCQSCRRNGQWSFAFSAVTHETHFSLPYTSMSVSNTCLSDSGEHRSAPLQRSGDFDAV